MNSKPKTKLDSLISTLENRLSRLKAVRAALDDEVIADDIAELFSEHTKGGLETQSPPPKVRSKVLKKTMAFFESHENAPATLREIMAATKVNIHSLRQVLYKSAADEFERHGQPGAQRETKFWLKRYKEEPIDESNEKAP